MPGRRPRFSILGAWAAAILLSAVVMIVGYAATALPHERALSLVYNKVWFAAVFLALAASLLANAVVRRPTVRRLGPLLTHLGILVIIGGGFLSWGLAESGSVTIEQGKSSSDFDLPHLKLLGTLKAESLETASMLLKTDEDTRSQLDAQIFTPTISFSGLVSPR